jgi:hypothetical protein
MQAGPAQLDTHLARERDQGSDNGSPHDRVTSNEKVSQLPINWVKPFPRGGVRMFSDHQWLCGRCPGDKVNVSRGDFTPFKSGSHQKSRCA